MLYQTCNEALPNTFSSEKIQYLTKIIRKQHYFHDDAIQMDMQDVILCLVEILKYKLTNIRSRGGGYSSGIQGCHQSPPGRSYCSGSDL